MILVVGSKMLPKSHCMLKAKNLSFIFLEEAFSNSCARALADIVFFGKFSSYQSNLEDWLAFTPFLAGVCP